MSKCSRYIYIYIYIYIHIFIFIPCIYPISVKVLFRLWHSEEDDKTRMMGIAGHCGDASCIGGLWLWVLGEEANKTNGNKNISGWRVKMVAVRHTPKPGIKLSKRGSHSKAQTDVLHCFYAQDRDAGWHIWLVERVGSKFAFYPDATLHV